LHWGWQQLKTEVQEVCGSKVWVDILVCSVSVGCPFERNIHITGNGQDQMRSDIVILYYCTILIGTAVDNKLNFTASYLGRREQYFRKVTVMICVDI
jgi:hypothetical protein